MNFALSDEQVLLREAARGALSRFKTIEAAREALEQPDALPDLWPMAVEAGWPGLLIDDAHGGAELGAFDALLVAEECGRVLASVPLLGLVPATAILNTAGDESLSQIAAGELRPAYVPARPPDQLERRWTVDPRSGLARAQAPKATISGQEVTLDGEVAFVPDAPGADLLVAVGVAEDGSAVAAAVPASSDGVSVEPVMRYDATRSLGHVSFSGAPRPPARCRRRCAGRCLVSRAGADRRRVAGRGADVSRDECRVRQGAVHVRPGDRLLPGDQARAHRGAAPAGEQPRSPVLRGLGARCQAGGVPAGGERRTSGSRPRARLRGSSDDQRARRDRCDVGARRTAVLPPGAARATTGWRDPRRDRPGCGADAQRRRGVAARRRRGVALSAAAE